MTLNRSKLLDAITMVKAGASENPIVEQSGDVIFTGDYIRSFNDELSVMYPFELDVSGSVPADELVKYLKAIKDEEIEVTVRKDKEFIIKGKKNKAGFVFNPKILLDFDTISFQDSWRKLPVNFVEAIKFTNFSTGSDASKPVLLNVQVKGDLTYSTDGYRLTEYKLASKVKDSFLVQSKFISDLINVNPIEYQIVDNWVHMRNDKNIIYSFRTQEFQFPNCSKLFDQFEGQEIKLPLDLTDVLESVGVFSQSATRIDRDIQITYSKNKVTIRSENQKGWAEEEKRVRYTGEDFTMVMRLDFIRDICKHRCIVKHAEHRQMLFESDNYRHLMMLKFLPTTE